MNALELSEDDGVDGGGSNSERIRIAYVIHSLDVGGAERQLLQLISHLDRTRFEPLLISGRPSLERGQTDRPDEVLWGVSPAPVLSPILYLMRIGKLAKILRKFKPHILHAFLGERTLIMSAAAEIFHPVPLLIANRRSSVGVYRDKLWKTLAERMAMKRVDAMLTNCKSLRDEVAGLDGFRNVEIIHNGVDTELFHPGGHSELREKMGWSDENIVVGMVANFRSCKRHEDFVTAAHFLHQRLPQTRFVLMGNDRGTLGLVTRQIRTLGLNDVFTIISGSLKPEVVYPALDIYVCASESEGFGNAVLEAMACARPIIATAVGGIVEAIDNEVEGLLVPPCSPAAIMAAAERLIRNPELGTRLGKAARKRVQARYSILAMVRAHQEFYLEALHCFDPKSDFPRTRNVSEAR